MPKMIPRTIENLNDVPQSIIPFRQNKIQKIRYDKRRQRNEKIIANSLEYTYMHILLPYFNCPVLYPLDTDISELYGKTTVCQREER